MTLPTYLQSLNPAQQQAASHTTGPLLLVAGAGAGKTRTVAHRIAHLIHTTTTPERILGITFTNKAAKELRDRVRALLAEMGVSLDGTEPLITTFHGLGVHILKDQAPILSRSRWFSILDRDDSISALKRIMKARGYDPKHTDPRKVLNAISSRKSALETADEYGSSASHPFAKQTAELWRAYDELLADSNAYDFDDLVAVPVRLLRDNQSVREYYQNKFTHVHIDEYQDTSNAQDLFSRLLVGKEENICVVGDSDQSIYGWRDADPSNLLHFSKHYPNATLVVLDQNYRSTKPIIEAANEIISKNTARHDKTLFTERESTDRLTIYEAANEYDEARYVARAIQKNLSSGKTASDIAILYRANYQSRALEEALLQYSIPYQLIGVRFYERKEIKDALSYLSLAINPNDQLSFLRCINTPKRGLGPKAQETILTTGGEGLTGSALKKYGEFKACIEQIQKCIGELPASEVVNQAIELSGLKKDFEANDETERVQNLQELVSLASHYNHLPGAEGIMALLEHASLMSDQDEVQNANEGGIRLMTIHAAKGLEFHTVYIVGLEQGLFPSERQDTVDPKAALEEERRLCYVAITRAKDALTLSYASVRTVYGSTQPRIPSEFLSDLPPHLLTFESAAGSGGGIFKDKTEPDLDIIQWDCLG